MKKNQKSRIDGILRNYPDFEMETRRTDRVIFGN